MRLRRDGRRPGRRRAALRRRSTSSSSAPTSAPPRRSPPRSRPRTPTRPTTRARSSSRPRRSGAGSASTTPSCATCASPPSSTTSARSPCPRRSSTSPARSTARGARDHGAPHDRRRADPRARSSSSPASRELVRHEHERWDGARLPRRPRRRGDPARLADHPRLRRAARDDHRPPVPRGAAARGRASRSCAATPARSSTRAVVDALLAILDESPMPRAHGCVTLPRLASAAMPRRILAALVAALSLLALPAAAQAAKAKPSYYVSLGDSYAAGYQRFRRPRRRTTRDGFAYQLVGKAQRARLQAQARQLRLRRRDQRLDPQAQDAVRRPRPGRRGLRRPDPGAAAERFLRRTAARSKLITVSIGGNDVTSCAREADPVACVGPAMDKRQGQRQEAAQAPAQGGRPEDPDRRHHLPRRDPRLLGRREPEPGPREALRRRLPVAAQPGAEGDVRVGRGAASSTSRRPPAPTRRSSRRPRSRPTARSPSPSPRSASSRPTAPTATSTRTRTGYAIIADLIAKTLPHKH